MAEGKTIRVALAGNPNSGKTTLFNRLTGSRHAVGNYPGVTVEKRVGRRVHGDATIEFVDLPGTYGLTAYSLEELVARNYVVEEKPDVVVDVVDASNLERNLYLAVQLMELGAPLVLALNMSDVARERGYLIDHARLSALLGVPAVPTVATRGTGCDELLETIVTAAGQGRRSNPASVRYGREIEDELGKIEALVAAEEKLPAGAPRRWLALKLLESDSAVTERVNACVRDPSALEAAVAASQRHLQTVRGDRPEILVADRRYGFISGACTEAVKTTVELRHDLSDTIDVVMTHPFLGPVIFVGLMFGVFWFVFSVGGPLQGLLELGIGAVGRGVSGLWPEGSDSPLRSLLVDGVIGGVGTVLMFLPNLVLLFMALAFLEDSGYMARAAFVMDRYMHRLGLHGKSFIPMLIGFGCSVPGIMATRTLEDRRDRLTTILVLPFISCSARLPIYMMILPAFFPRWQAPVLLVVYLVGIVTAILMARLIKRTILKGETAPFVIELPPYRMPTLRGTIIHTWERTSGYLKKAGTLILLLAIVMWALTSYPKPSAEAVGAAADEAELRQVEVSHSFAGRIGRTIAPAMQPLGFDWRISTALIPTFAAKEAFVTQMGIVFSLGEGEDEDDRRMVRLQEELRATYSPLVGFCIVVFCLLTVPCMATLAVAWKETGFWGWAALQLVGYTAVAYVVTLVIYQSGLAFGIGT